jgi:hypothetical protein
MAGAKRRLLACRFIFYERRIVSERAKSIRHIQQTLITELPRGEVDAGLHSKRYARSSSECRHTPYGV